MRKRIRGSQSSGRRWLSAALACAALAPAAVPATALGIGFTAPANHAVGDSPVWMAVGNFNGGVDPDLAVVNTYSNNVSVLLGGAGASFGAASNYGVGAYPTSVAAANFNADVDSSLDLAVTNGEAPSGPDTVSILLGTSGGTFGAPTDFSISGGPRRLAVGDFDAGADPDLAVTNGNADAVSVRLGGAGATFGSQANFSVADSPSGLAVGDFNADAVRDLAVANGGSDNVSVLLGVGDGTFGTATNYSVGDNPGFVAAGDFNGDADPDLAVTNLWSDDISVLLGGAGGTFGAATTYAVGQGPASVAVGDISGDGDPDLAVADSHSPAWASGVSVLLGGVGGSFGTPTKFAVAGAPSAVAIADFNADGDLDIATANAGSDTASILLNTANAPSPPTFTGIEPASPANGNTPKIRGAAPAGSTVRLYTTPDCSGAPSATGSAAEFASPGLTVSVQDDSTTTFRATATNTADVPSACSSTAVTYVEHSSPPRAAIAVSPNPVLTGAAVTFDASSSTGFGITRYEWDLDGDGSFETDTGSSPSATRFFAAPAEISAGVRVSNDLGSTETRTPLSVRLAPPPGPLGVSINRGAQFTNDASVTIAAVWPPLAMTMLISNDGGFASPGRFPVAAQTQWALDSSGPERLPKTVYVRFDDSSQTFTDDIILDETAPTVTLATASPVGSESARSAVAASNTRTYVVRIDARDNMSGVRGVQVTGNKRNPGKLRQYKRTSRLRRSMRFTTASSRIYVRVRDAAGNYSRWRRAKHPAD